VIAIESVAEAINQIAQTTLRSVVGRHTLDEALSETDKINENIKEILDVQTEEWGIEVTVVELRDIQLPDSMKRAMARQAEAEREKRAKIIAAEGEALAAGELAHASDVMMAHPLALQLRNLQTLVEVAVDKNSTVVFPTPLVSTIGELGAFLARETKAAAEFPTPPALPKGMNTERHVIGFDTHINREGRWARWGGAWGVLFGAFFSIPGVGHVALGGYVLYLGERSSPYGPDRSVNTPMVCG
jgi:hypothetical protein